MEARLEQLLAAAPGPAPWYWKSFPPFTIRGRTWHWRSEPTRALGEWPALWRDDGACCFVPAFYTYLARASHEDLLAWRACLSGAVEIRVYGVPELATVDVPDEHPREHDVSRRARELITIPPLEQGVHEGFALETPIATDELLLLSSRSASSDEQPALAIYRWQPASGRITVSPQPWFTGATHDLGYEWVTKVARDPTTGRIVGAAIRIPAFELEDDDMTVRRWLTDAWGQPG